MRWFLLLVVVALAVGQQAGDETCHQDGTCRKEEPALGLPESPLASDGKIEVWGGSFSLGENMGPLVVNEDGTAKRIANWAEMTAGERETTMRVIKKRNLKRMRDIKEQRLELLNNAADAKVLPSHLNEISESVYQSFEVFFKGSDKRSPLLSVGQGRELTQAIAKFPPMVVWSAPSGGGTGAPRTIAVVSRNGRYEDRHGGKATLMWMVVDVKGDCNSTHCTYDPAGGESSGTEVFPYSGPVPRRQDTQAVLIAAYDQPFDSDLGKAIREEGGLEPIKDDFSLDQFCWKHGMVGDGAKGLAWFSVNG